MAKSTSIKDAVANFEKAKGVVAAEAEKVKAEQIGSDFCLISRLKRGRKDLCHLEPGR